MPAPSRAIATDAVPTAVSVFRPMADLFPAGISFASTMGGLPPHPSACPQMTPPPTTSNCLRLNAMANLRCGADTRPLAKDSIIFVGERSPRLCEHILGFLQDR